MVRWVVGSIVHGVDPLCYFSFQPVLHDWCNKGRGMCYPVCGMVHVKEPLLLIGKCNPFGGPIQLFLVLTKVVVYITLPVMVHTKSILLQSSDLI